MALFNLSSVEQYFTFTHKYQNYKNYKNRRWKFPSRTCLKEKSSREKRTLEPDQRFRFFSFFFAKPNVYTYIRDQEEFQDHGLGVLSTSSVFSRLSERDPVKPATNIYPRSVTPETLDRWWGSFLFFHGAVYESLVP